MKTSNDETWFQLAIKLHGEERYRDALDFMQALEKRLPDDPRLLAGLGVVYRDSGDLIRAEDYLRRACAEDPEDAAAHFNLALTLLRGGRWREGFREYEWRWRVAQFAGQRREFQQQLWRGEALNGRRILLWGEQGAGDAIQFVRYAQLVRDADGDVSIDVLPNLERLMNWLDGGWRVNADGPFDLHCPLMSLPERFGTELGSIPAAARFTVPAEVRGKWSGRLRRGMGRSVGVVWSTNPAAYQSGARSMPAECLLAFTTLPGFEFWSLQVGAAAGDVPEGVVSLAEELVDFGETAAVISELDLVITVDTAVAHVAGSLGKPVWLLLNYASDWRWMLDREDSPWYPTMRIFRQTRPGEWGDVAERVESAARNF